MQTFFDNEAAYRAWIAGIPAIFPCNQEVVPEKQDDPKQPWAATTEGPYYYSPQFLLLRVGSGAAAQYCAVQRVNSYAEADFYWFVRAPFSGQEEGERVYAAYIWNVHVQPERIVAGNTLSAARTLLAEHLSPHPLQSAITKRLS